MDNTSANINLVPFIKEHYGRLIGWIPDDKFLLQWGGPSFDFPLTVAQIDSLVNSGNLLCYSVMKGGELIGHAEIRLDKSTESAVLCRILIGEASALGKGYCPVIIGELLRISFEEHNTEKVTLNVFDFNRGAIRCYEKAGFTKEKFIEKGRKYKDEYWSYWKMSITKSEWKKK